MLVNCNIRNTAQYKFAVKARNQRLARNFDQRLQFRFRKTTITVDNT